MHNLCKVSKKPLVTQGELKRLSDQLGGQNDNQIFSKNLANLNGLVRAAHYFRMTNPKDISCQCFHRVVCKMLTIQTDQASVFIQTRMVKIIVTISTNVLK